MSLYRCHSALSMDILEPTILYGPPGLALQNYTFSPHSVFMCFVSISEQTAIISLHKINWLVCITETDSVYCAVRTESSYIIQGNARSVVNKVALGQIFPPSISVFPWPEFRVETCCLIIKLFVKCVLVVTENLGRYYDYYEVSYKDSPFNIIPSTLPTRLQRHVAPTRRTKAQNL
jgi:hypothetical protein